VTYCIPGAAIPSADRPLVIAAIQEAVGEKSGAKEEEIMKGVMVSALMLAVTLDASFVWAEDFKSDRSACWDEPRQDMSCTKLTDKFLMSLRFKTRREIQQAMNSAGRDTDTNNPDYDPHGLHFINNYTRGRRTGAA
jgi:hypothetical protein